MGEMHVRWVSNIRDDECCVKSENLCKKSFGTHRCYCVPECRSVYIRVYHTVYRCTIHLHDAHEYTQTNFAKTSRSGLDSRRRIRQFSVLESSERIESCLLHFDSRMSVSNKRFLGTHEGINWFIALFKKHTNLWDPQDQNFRKIPSRSESVTQISRELGVSVLDVNKKIWQMKAKFKECWIRSQWNENEPISWPYYTQLLFLEKYYRLGEGRCDQNEPYNKVVKVKRISNNSSIASASRVKRSTGSFESSTCNTSVKVETSAAAPSDDSIDDFFRAMATMVKLLPRKNIAQLKFKFLEYFAKEQLTLGIQKEIWLIRRRWFCFWFLSYQMINTGKTYHFNTLRNT